MASSRAVSCWRVWVENVFSGRYKPISSNSSVAGSISTDWIKSSVKRQRVESWGGKPL
jgi:hypothetical protein